MKKRVLAASTVGTALEWYDFALYGLASALVFDRLFFPDAGAFGVLASFATFAVGFFFRPLGGAVIGHFGDRLGRRTMLFVTLGLMGTASTLIGLLPSYGSIGVAAPVLLVLLRILQGVGSGAEYAGAALLTTEYADRGRRGLFGSFPVVGNGAGMLLATGAFSLVSSMPEPMFLAWGWRVPFLASLVLAGYVPSVFALSYLTDTVGVDESVGLTAVLAGNSVRLVTPVLFGALSDRVGRKPVYVVASLFCAALSFPFFLLLDTGAPVAAVVAIVAMLGIADGALLGPQPAFYAELFGADVRYSAIALSREFSAAAVGGTAPFIAAALVQVAGGTPWLMAGYMCLLFAAAAVAARMLPEPRGADLQASTSERADQQRSAEPEMTRETGHG